MRKGQGQGWAPDSRGWLQSLCRATLSLMPTCVAMFRGVNVGSVAIRMDRLRAEFEALGFSTVRTYVQSGNVVFDTTLRGPSAALGREIEGRVLRSFGFAVPVILKTARQMADIVRNNPFVGEKGVDAGALHVTFLSAKPGPKTAERLGELAARSERFCIHGREIYLYCPDGYGRSRLSNNCIERKLSVTATTRNWRTVTALFEMARGTDG